MSPRLLAPAAAISLAVVLGACAVGPTYRTPETTPADFVNPSGSTYTSAPVEARWWSAFEDPTLDELQRRAFAGNLDLAVAAARVREARSLFRGTRLEALPHVTASASASDGRVPQPDLGAVSTGETFQAGFDARWEIDLFGRVRRGVEAARADADAAASDLRAAQVLIAAEVGRTYFEYLGARDRLAVAGRNLATQRDTLRLTETRFSVGVGDAGDVASARAALAATEASTAAFSIQASQASHRLAVLVGERPGALDGLLGAPHPSRILVKPLPIGEAADLLRRRPDVRAAERRLAAQTARVGVATADLFPRVSVTGFVGFLSGDLSSLGGEQSRMWRATPAVTWPAFDMASARARLRVQEARSDAALAEYRQAVLVSLEEVENALVGYAQTQSRLSSLAERAAASRKAAELARLRYRAGTTDFLTLLDAERTLLDAEDAESAAQTALNTQVVALYKALGGGWEA